MRNILAAAAMVLAASSALAQNVFEVRSETSADEKSVFATVESLNVVPARARIGGSVVDLRVKEGDKVAGGQVIAAIGDEKLALQVRSLDAQISALEAQLSQAQTTLTRYENLFANGTIPKASLDQARTAAEVASNALKARTAERAIVQRQVVEGQVLAPTSGRVLAVMVTPGTVVLSGEPVATVAEENYVLRLRIPERHARHMKVGDKVRIDSQGMGDEEARVGSIVLVYPVIEDGRVVADAAVGGLGDYFVGERVRVWVAADSRQVVIVPERFLYSRSGVDFVRLKSGDSTLDVPVQRGLQHADGIEILSGIKAGDELVQP